MAILSQFLLRLTFGLAAGMAITSPQQVSSGYFRNHLYVTLGLATLAALVCYTAGLSAFWYAVGAVVASYFGSVIWLYDKKDAGRIALLFVMLCALAGSFSLIENSTDSLEVDRYFPVVHHDLTEPQITEIEHSPRRMGYVSGALYLLSNVTSGLLLGITTAAMFLGHWYLNSPTMDLAPLRRLLVAMGAALCLQMIVSAAGVFGELYFATEFSTQWVLFVLLRWLFGLVGVAVLTWMAWRTLEIPNTQSATGILYVAVIGVFVGELAAALLSAESAFPL